MPTNLHAEAKFKWAEATATKDPRKKIQLLQEFLSLIPKHKGTAKLCVQVKKQIATLKKEIEAKKQKKQSKGRSKFFIDKEGAAQIALIGLSNVGKSSLLSAITNASVKISPRPYTTKIPIPGMFNFRDVQFQILETPALIKGASDGKAWGLQTLALARNADGLIVMVDLSQDPIGQLSLILSELEKIRIIVNKPKGQVIIERKHRGFGLQNRLIGKLVGCTIKDVKKLLESYRIKDAIIKIFGEVTLDEIEDALFENTTYKPVIIVANKIDLFRAKEKFQLLRTYNNDQFPILPVSCKNREGLEILGEILFKSLEIICVYTKEPNIKSFSKKPFVLKKGATIKDLAKNIHSDFNKKFSFAKVWSKRLNFSPQKVGSTFILEDNDVVELHIK